MWFEGLLAIAFGLGGVGMDFDNQAIGAGTLPSGGAIATEIEQHEFVMKHDRKRWNSDERLQARYRELLRMRDE